MIFSSLSSLADAQADHGKYVYTEVNDEAGPFCTLVQVFKIQNGLQYTKRYLNFFFFLKTTIYEQQ